MINNTNCNTCGGLISGVIYSNCINPSPIKLCSCNPWYSASCNRQGWICSRCNKSLSPDVKECDCSQSQGCYPYVPYVPNPWIPINPLVPFTPINPLQPWDSYTPYTITCSTYNTRNP